jgi:hypothetical protein
MKTLSRLSWRGRGTGALCTAEVDQPVRGFRVGQKNKSNPFAVSAVSDSTPTVSGITFDGDTYWVQLSAAQGWPRTIRVTQHDVDEARFRLHADDSE